MKVGTKSVLWGVHAWWWHPITVARAWRAIYGAWPSRLAEWVAIFCHDLGYAVKCHTMDGPDGVLHPERGARLAYWLTHHLFVLGHFWLRPWKWGQRHRYVSRYAWCDIRAANEATVAREMVLGHSKRYAHSERGSGRVSALYWPDKCCVLFDPPWFYLLRGRLSGEVAEYVANSPMPKATPARWFEWYTNKREQDFIRLLEERNR